MKEGDKNSRSFHNAANGRHNNKIIEELEKDDLI